MLRIACASPSRNTLLAFRCLFGLDAHKLGELRPYPVVAVAARRAGAEPLAFFVVAAGVIPILFLALVYQSRFIRTASSGVRHWAVYLGTVSAVVGEVLSLRALTHGYVVGNGAEHKVVTSLAVLGVVVAIDPLDMVRDCLVEDAWTKDEHGKYPEEAVILANVVLVVAGIGILYWLDVMRGWPWSWW